MPKFKLEPLLQHRKHIEDIFQRELAETVQALTAEESALDQLLADHDRIQNDLKEKLNDKIDAAEMLHFHKYLDELALEINGQKTKVAEAEQKLELKRMELTEAMKDRKIMDKLKDKQIAAEVDRLEKHEQNFMNEIAISRHLRSR